MTQAAPLSAPSPLLLRNLLWAHAMLLAAALIIGAAYGSWYSLRGQPKQVTKVGITAIIAGLGATIALAGAMHFLDVPLAAAQGPRWYWRIALKLYKRGILLAQLAATAIAIGAAFVLIFGFKMPLPS